MLSIFSGACWQSVCPLWKNMYSGLLPIFGFIFWEGRVWLHHVACGILVSPPGIESQSSAVEVWNNHCTSREFPFCPFFNWVFVLSMLSCMSCLYIWLLTSYWSYYLQLFTCNLHCISLEMIWRIQEDVCRLCTNASAYCMRRGPLWILVSMGWGRRSYLESVPHGYWGMAVFNSVSLWPENILYSLSLLNCVLVLWPKYGQVL